MRILLIDNGSAYIGQLRNWLSAHEIITVPFGSPGGLDWHGFDLVVLSGGHTFEVINHDAEYRQELFLIKSCTKPVLGICLGFELIVHGFGGSLKRMEKSEHGNLMVEALDADPLFAGIGRLEVYENHRWVAEDPGPELEAVGRSRDGIEVVRHKTKPVYGFQFHPEVIVDADANRLLLKNIEHWAK